MPLVAYKDLPAFKRLIAEGSNVLPKGRALSQEIRELHIGLLNMMPDAALEATERQFFRLIGESNQIAQFYVHPFSLPQIPRGAETKAYIDQHYETFEQLKQDGLDALIISGANVSDPDLSQAPFWEPLQEVLAWSWENVTSTLCSCLATHAVLEFKYGQKRGALEDKLWGVYQHKVLDRHHPLMRGVNTIFDVPHSRHNDISRAQFDAAGMMVLAQCKEAGVHLATSADGLRLVCFQGHPEYDTLSLYKEYKREALLHARGGRKDFPAFPKRYLTPEAQEKLGTYVQGSDDWPYEDTDMVEIIDNTWRDTSRSILGNWIGQVYQLTNMDRRKAFMDGVDPNNLILPHNYQI